MYKELLLANYDVKIAAIGKTELVSKIDKQDILYFNNLNDLIYLINFKTK